MYLLYMNITSHHITVLRYKGSNGRTYSEASSTLTLTITSKSLKIRGTDSTNTQHDTDSCAQGPLLCDSPYKINEERAWH